MSDSFRHNGCDTLMLGFDYELRRLGFAGNSCQIILELSHPIDRARLEQRVTELAREHAILRSRPVRGLNLQPRWKPTTASPKVRVHVKKPGLLQALFNEPLDTRRGELIRFDIVENTVVFTWAHALMDAKSAEYFLVLAGGKAAPDAGTGEDWYGRRGMSGCGLRERGKQAWRELHRLDVFRKALPVSLGTRRKPVTRTMKYQAVTLSAGETAQVRANASRHCGFLGDGNFHFAATLMELHRLHERMAAPSASYVMPIAIGLRPKGARAPVFSNQVTTMLHQFLPGELGSFDKVVAAVKDKNTEFLRDEHINPGIVLAQMFRRLPLPVYMRIVKSGLGGEICSLFFGDTAATDPLLQDFFGARVEKFFHVPAVTVPPGVGVVFYRFRDQLQFTIVHADGTLTDAGADEFAACIRNRLLNP